MCKRVFYSCDLYLLLLSSLEVSVGLQNWQVISLTWHLHGLEFKSVFLPASPLSEGISRACSLLHAHVIRDWGTTVKMGIPALLYVIQNQLLFMALANLDPATYQVYICTCFILYTYYVLYIVHYIHYKLYTTHCTVYIIHCTLYVVHYTFYIIHTIHCTLYIVLCSLYIRF